MDVVIDGCRRQRAVAGGFLDHRRDGDGFRVGVAAGLDGLFGLLLLLGGLVGSGRRALILSWRIISFRGGRLLLRWTGVERHR